MVDRQAVVTGVPTEGFDSELDKTGVPADAPATPAPEPDTEPAEAPFEEPDRSFAHFANQQAAKQTTIGPPTSSMLVGDDRDLVQAVLAEYDPSLMGNPAAMDQALRSLDQAWSPEMRNLMLSSEAGSVGVTEALSLSSKEYLMAKMLEMGLGDETTSSRMLGALLHSTIVGYEDRAAKLHRPGNVFHDQATVANDFEKGQVTVEDLGDVVDLTPYAEAEAAHFNFKDSAAFNRFAASGEVREVLARGGVWKVKDSTLVFGFEDDGGTLISGVHLDQGTTITTLTEALAALVEAKSGERHRLLGDQATGGRVAAGIAVKFIGDTVRWTERSGKNAADAVLPEGWQPEWDYTDEREEAERLSQSRIESGGVTDEVFVSLRESPETVGMSAEGIYAAAAEITADEGFQEDYTNMTADDIVEQARIRNDEQGTWVDWAQETVVPPVVDMLQSYDKLVHGIGLTFIAPVKAAVYELDGDAATTFQQAFDESRESEWVSEAFGIDPSSAWGQSVNLGASLLFDPVVWVTPGAKASWGWLSQVTTNPSMTRHLVAAPQFRSAVRQVVKGNDSRIVLSLMSDGIDDDAVLALLKVSAAKVPASQRAARYAEVADILEKQLPAHGGAWLPAGPRTMVHAKNVTGIGASIQDMSRRMGASSSPQVKKTIARWASVWARASKDRAVSLSDDFVIRAMELAVWRHPDDMNAVVKIVESALDAKVSMQAGSVEDIAALRLRLEAAKRDLQAARRTISGDTDLRSLPQYRKFADELKGVSAAADEAGGGVPLVVGESGSPLAADAAITGDGFGEALRRTTSYVDAHGGRFDELNAVVAEKRAAMREISAELGTLQQPKNRKVLADWVDDFYNGWADDVGVPRIDDGKGNLVPDWDKVHGGRGSTVDGEVDASWFTGYVGNTSQVSDMSTAERLAAREADDVAEGLRGVGVGPERTVRVTQASPIEMLGYKHGSEAYRKAMAAAPIVSADGVSRGLDVVQNVFASSVLLNMNTPYKTHLDEIIRFMEDAGMGKAAAGVRTAPLVERVGARGSQLSSRGAAYGREAGSPAAARQQTWSVVSAKKHPEAAERFVNGTMVRDSVVQRYAKARLSGDRTAWVKWWDEEGVKLAQGVGKKGRMTADEAWDAVENGINLFVRRGDEALDPKIVDEVLNAAAEGRQASLSKAQWRQFPDVPGQTRPKGGIIDNAFEQLYGRPSNARGAVIFEHYYEFKRGLLIEAANGGATKNGVRIGPDKVLRNMTGEGEAERLVAAGIASSLDDAGDMLRMGRANSKVKSLLDDGWKLESDIDSAAASYAKAQADSMMYQMGAVSVGGKRLARLFPWGRAQVDYMGYWMRKMGEPTTFKVPLSKSPNLSITPRGPTSKVNVRLMDRIGHLATTNPDTDSGQPVPYSPEWAIAGWTFLPSKLDESFIMENTPSMGPLPSWAVNFFPEDHPIRRAVSQVAPSHPVFNDYQNEDVFSSVGNLYNAILPDSGRSVRRLITDQIVGRGISLFGNSENEIWNTLVEINEPAFFRDNMTIELGDWLSSDVFDPASVFGGADTNEVLNDLVDRATKRSYSRTANEGIKKNLGAPSYMGEEAQYAKFYLPMVDKLPEWVEAGYISDGAADNLRIAAEQAGDGLVDNAAVGSYPDLRVRKDLANAGQDILFRSLPKQERNQFILANPGAAVNMVRWNEVDERLVPDKYKEYVSNGRIEAPSSVRDDMYRDGFDDGWIVARDPERVISDVVGVVYRAASAELKAVWEDNLPWGWTTTSRAKLAAPLTTRPELAAEIGALFDSLNVEIPDGWVQADGSWQMSAGSLKSHLVESRKRFTAEFTVDPAVNRVLAASQSDTELLSDMKQGTRLFSDAGFDTPVEAHSGDEWDESWALLLEDYPTLKLPGGSPEALREIIRERHRDEIVKNDNYTAGMYAAEFEDEWGPLNYEPPNPPPVSQLEVAFTSPSSAVSVVDGDTVELVGKDGEVVPFRLIGVNTPEKGQEGYAESTAALVKFLRQHDNVTIGLFDRAKYGDTQSFWSQTSDGPVKRERVFGWLYVDGVPIYDPSLFDETNVRGAPQGVGGSVPDFDAWWRRETAEVVD